MGKGVVLCLVLLICEPHLARASEYSSNAFKQRLMSNVALSCEVLEPTYDIRLERFLLAISPLLQRKSIADSLRVWIKHGEADPNAQRYACGQELIESLKCTSPTVEEEQCRNKNSFWVTSDLAELVHGAISTVDKPGCSVYEMKSDAGVKPFNLKGMAFDVAKGAAEANKHDRAFKSLQKLLEQGAIKDLVSNRITPKTIELLMPELGESDPAEASRKAEEAFHALVGDVEYVSVSKLGSAITNHLNEEASKLLEGGLNELLALKVPDLQLLIKDGLKHFKLNNSHLTPGQVELLYNIITKKSMPLESFKAFFKDDEVLDSQYFLEMLKDADLNKDGSISYNELMKWVNQFLDVEEEGPSTSTGGGDVHDVIDLEEGMFGLGTLSTISISLRSARKNAVRKIFAEAIAEAVKLGDNILNQFETRIIDYLKTHPDVTKLNVKLGELHTRFKAATSESQTLLQKLRGVISSSAANGPTKTIKLVVWGLIYFICLVMFLYAHRFQTFSPAEASEMSGSATPTPSPAAEGEQSTTKALVWYLPLAQFEQQSRDQFQSLNEFQSLLQATAGGLTDKWKLGVWLTAILFLVIYYAPVLAWKLTGARHRLAPIFTANPKWFLQDDITSLIFAIILFVPLIVYLWRYYQEKVDAPTVSRVFLELLGVLATYQLALLTLQRSTGSDDTNFVAKYLELHSKDSSDVESDCEGKSLAEVSNTILKEFLESYKFEYDCDFQAVLDEFHTDPNNHKITEDLITHLVVTSLCEDQMKYGQRQRILVELAAFESVLVRLSLAYHDKMSLQTREEVNSLRLEQQAEQAQLQALTLAQTAPSEGIVAASTMLDVAPDVNSLAAVPIQSEDEEEAVAPQDMAPTEAPTVLGNTDSSLLGSEPQNEHVAEAFAPSPTTLALAPTGPDSSPNSNPAVENVQNIVEINTVQDRLSPKPYISLD